MFDVAASDDTSLIIPVLAHSGGLPDETELLNEVKYNNSTQIKAELSEKYQLELPNVRNITLAFYLVTFVFGIVGNSLVIYVISKFNKVRTKSVANIYILNLAIADELFIFTLPLFCYATYSQDWVFGDLLCKVAYVTREVNKFTSIFTLVALSIDR